MKTAIIIFDRIKCSFFSNCICSNSYRDDPVTLEKPFASEITTIISATDTREMSLMEALMCQLMCQLMCRLKYLLMYLLMCRLKLKHFRLMRYYQYRSRRVKQGHVPLKVLSSRIFIILDINRHQVSIRIAIAPSPVVSSWAKSKYSPLA